MRKQGFDHGRALRDAGNDFFPVGIPRSAAATGSSAMSVLSPRHEPGRRRRYRGRAAPPPPAIPRYRRGIQAASGIFARTRAAGRQDRRIRRARPATARSSRTTPQAFWKLGRVASSGPLLGQYFHRQFFTISGCAAGRGSVEILPVSPRAAAQRVRQYGRDPGIALVGALRLHRNSPERCRSCARRGVQHDTCSRRESGDFTNR